MLTITPITYDDLPKIAEIHIRVWQQTYPGQMPQDYLDSLDSATRLQSWREVFTKNKSDKRHGVLVARWSQEIVGFLCYGPARDESHNEWIEIYAINILKEPWSKGIGYKLFASACSHFKDNGIKQTYLWVLDTNENALHAYRRWGGIVEDDHIKFTSIGEADLKEIRILFNIA